MRGVLRKNKHRYELILQGYIYSLTSVHALLSVIVDIKILATTQVANVI